MQTKKRFNEIYVSLLHIQLLISVPILWMFFMDEGSIATRFLFPLTLVTLMLVLSKKIAQVLHYSNERTNKEAL